MYTYILNTAFNISHIWKLHFNCEHLEFWLIVAFDSKSFAQRCSTVLLFAIHNSQKNLKFWVVLSHFLTLLLRYWQVFPFVLFEIQ